MAIAVIRASTLIFQHVRTYVRSTVNEVDSTAVKQLLVVYREFKTKYRVRLLIANVRGGCLVQNRLQHRHVRR